MSKVTMRMKNKMLSKVHLDTSGNMIISGLKATSDSASKGLSAQPANPLTEMENTGNPGLPPSQMTSTKLAEPATGGPAERLAPETLPEKDIQPVPQDLSSAPSQLTPGEKAMDEAGLTLGLEAEALEGQPPAPEAPSPAPHEQVPAATADNVLKTEASASTELPKLEQASKPAKL